MMKKFSIVVLFLALASCQEKIWYDDLREKTIDTICGTYGIISAEWEGDPIDVDNDGIPTTDYFKECEAEYYTQTRFSSNGSVLLRLPSNTAFVSSTFVDLLWSEDSVNFTYDVLFDNDEPYLSFNLPERVLDISVTGYGEVEMRVEMTVNHFKDGNVEVSTAPVYFKFVRLEYHK